MCGREMTAEEGKAKHDIPMPRNRNNSYDDNDNENGNEDNGDEQGAPLFRNAS